MIEICRKMKNKLLIFITFAALIAAGGAFWAFRLSRSEEHKVKQVINQLVDLGKRPENPGPAELAIKITAIDNIFAEQVILDFGRRWNSGVFSNRSIEPLLVQYRKAFIHAELKMDDLTINIPDQETANALFSCRLTGKLHRGDYIEEVRDVECRLKKIEGSWRIDKLEVNEVLER